MTERAYFWVPPPHSRLVLLPVHIGKRQRWRMESDPFRGEVDPPEDDCGCSGGGGQVPLVYWAGVIWYGVPWPRRWWWFWGWPLLQFADLPGCGCIKFWKDLVREFRSFRRRHAITIEPVLKRQAARRWIFTPGNVTKPSADGDPPDAA